MPFSLEPWVSWVFDHPVRKPEWHRHYEGTRWDHPDASALHAITELFEAPARPLQRFSDAQLNQGFWLLCENAMFGLSDEQISWELRQRCVRSFVPLFRDLFAVRCTRHPSHLDRGGQSPAKLSSLNLACYMWWDFDCWVAKPNDGPHRRLDNAFLSVMEETLAIRHEACCESALHGLGHWHLGYPVETVQIIDGFLAPPRRSLRTYANTRKTPGAAASCNLQFSVGILSAWSITSISTGPFRASSLSPSCSWRAPKMLGSA